MSADPFDGILDPFAWWDVPGTYDRYSGFFDLVIYCSLFIALVHAVLAHRFPGRAGKAMSSVLGIALGVSLVLVEQQFGWSLRDASPIAALLALILVGFVILHTLVRVHVSWILAAPLTYIIVYLFIRAVSPELMAAIASRAPFVHLVAVVMFLVALWRLGVALWPHCSWSRGTESEARFVSRLDQGREERELGLVKHLRRHEAPEARRTTSRLVQDLRSLRDEVARSDCDWQAAARSTAHISHQADQVIAVLDRVRVLDQRIRNFDWHEMKQLGSYYQQLSPQDQAKLKDQILLERQKIVDEHAIEQLAEGCEQRHKAFHQLMDSCGAACMESNRAAALQYMEQAFEIEQSQKADTEALLKAEKKLLAVTRKKLQEEKHMK